MYGLSQETINQYNFSLGLIYKWMCVAIEARKKNIIHRLSVARARQEERNQKIEEDKQRGQDRQNALESAKDEFEAKNKDRIEAYKEYKEAVAAGQPPDLDDGEEPPTEPLFDEKYFLYNWDDEHPPLIIPPEVKDDVDNDWLLTTERKEELVAQYTIDLSDAQASIPSRK